MRLPDWEHRLHELIAANRDRPHVFGEWDCILWPLAAVKAITGKDFGRGHRKKYRSHASAYRHLKELGFASPEEALDSLFDEKPVGFAQRGDLVMTADGIPAVCVGSYALSAGQEGDRHGLVPAQRAEWVKAWTVGGK